MSLVFNLLDFAVRKASHWYADLTNFEDVELLIFSKSTALLRKVG